MHIYMICTHTYTYIYTYMYVSYDVSWAREARWIYTYIYICSYVSILLHTLLNYRVSAANSEIIHLASRAQSFRRKLGVETL